MAAQSAGSIRGGEPNATIDVRLLGTPGIGVVRGRERGNGANAGPFQRALKVTRFPIFEIEERAV